MTSAFRIVLLGFSEFERRTLASCFRLAASRVPSYRHVQQLADADFVVADADHGPSVQLVAATERMAQTVFIGWRAPPGSIACMNRPIDPLHVMRELDAMVEAGLRDAAATAASKVQPHEQALGPVHVVQALGVAAGPVVVPRDEAAPDPGPAPGALAVGGAKATAEPAPALAPSAAAAAEQAWPVVIPGGANPVRPAPVGALVLATVSSGVKPRALLVDDSEIALRFLETRLQPWGLQLDRAGSSERALELLAAHDYDFVFLDVELGEGSALDGLALCQHIKRHQGTQFALGSAIFMVSAHHSQLDRARGTLAGCDAYLGKPLQDAELARLLKRHGLVPPVPAADVALGGDA